MKTIYVGNLDYQTIDAELQKLFAVSEGSASTVPDMGHGKVRCDEHAIMGSLLRRGPLSTAIPR